MAKNTGVLASTGSAASGISRDAAPEGLVAALPGVAASAKMLELAPGLYAITIGSGGDRQWKIGDMLLPATHVFASTSSQTDQAQIFTTGSNTGWAGPDGGAIIVKVPAPGGRVLITTYRPADQEPIPLSMQIAPLGLPASFDLASTVQTSRAPLLSVAPAASSQPGLRTEIVLHIDQIGESRFPGGDWIGARGQKRYIEALSIRPLERLEAKDVEYKAFGPNGRQTPWVSDVKLCGSRGRGVALTGFAVRVAEHLRGQIDVFYEGGFFSSGSSALCSNGEPCMGSQSDDPLESVRIRFVERG